MANRTLVIGLGWHSRVILEKTAQCFQTWGLADRLALLWLHPFEAGEELNCPDARPPSAISLPLSLKLAELRQAHQQGQGYWSVNWSHWGSSILHTRLWGKLAIHTHYEQVREAFGKLVNDLKKRPGGGDEDLIYTYVVGHAHDPFDSGAFLDVAYMAGLTPKTQGYPSLRVYGLLLLPQHQDETDPILKTMLDQGGHGPHGAITYALLRELRFHLTAPSFYDNYRYDNYQGFPGEAETASQRIYVQDTSPFHSGDCYLLGDHPYHQRQEELIRFMVLQSQTPVGHHLGTSVQKAGYVASFKLLEENPSQLQNQNTRSQFHERQQTAWLGHLIEALLKPPDDFPHHKPYLLALMPDRLLRASSETDGPNTPSEPIDEQTISDLLDVWGSQLTHPPDLNELRRRQHQARHLLKQLEASHAKGHARNAKRDEQVRKILAQMQDDLRGNVSHLLQTQKHLLVEVQQETRAARAELERLERQAHNVNDNLRHTLAETLYQSAVSPTALSIFGLPWPFALFVVLGACQLIVGRAWPVAVVFIVGGGLMTRYILRDHPMRLLHQQRKETLSQLIQHTALMVDVVKARARWGYWAWLEVTLDDSLICQIASDAQAKAGTASALSPQGDDLCWQHWWDALRGLREQLPAPDDEVAVSEPQRNDLCNRLFDWMDTYTRRNPTLPPLQELQDAFEQKARQWLQFDSRRSPLNWAQTRARMTRTGTINLDLIDVSTTQRQFQQIFAYATGNEARSEAHARSQPGDHAPPHDDPELITQGDFDAVHHFQTHHANIHLALDQPQAYVINLTTDIALYDLASLESWRHAFHQHCLDRRAVENGDITLSTGPYRYAARYHPLRLGVASPAVRAAKLPAEQTMSYFVMALTFVLSVYEHEQVLKDLFQRLSLDPNSRQFDELCGALQENADVLQEWLNDIGTQVEAPRGELLWQVLDDFSQRLSQRTIYIQENFADWQLWVQQRLQDLILSYQQTRRMRGDLEGLKQLTHVMIYLKQGSEQARSHESL